MSLRYLCKFSSFFAGQTSNYNGKHFTRQSLGFFVKLTGFIVKGCIDFFLLLIKQCYYNSLINKELIIYLNKEDASIMNSRSPPHHKHPPKLNILRPPSQHRPLSSNQRHSSISMSLSNSQVRRISGFGIATERSIEEKRENNYKGNGIQSGREICDQYYGVRNVKVPTRMSRNTSIKNIQQEPQQHEIVSNLKKHFT